MADAALSSSDHQKLIDMLGNLPEHILLHILSFLPTKMAAKTSVLSKPWQHLWTLVPAIDLDYRGWSETLDESVISKVLEGNKSPIIRRFSLKCRDCTTSSLDQLLSFASERNAEELNLALRDRSIYSVEGYASKSFKTLVFMTVVTMDGYYNKYQIVIGGYFPNLKILHLETYFISGIFASSRFPLLEELVIVWRATFHHDINISLPMLRRLEISNSYSESVGKYALNIDAPSLQYLVLSGFESTGGFRVENLPILVEANIHVYHRTPDKKDDEYGESLVNFVTTLSNVRKLNLSFQTMKALCDVSFHSFFHTDRIPRFRSLVELDLEIDVSFLGIIMIMLSKSANLEHLKISVYSDNYDEKLYCLTPPKHVPDCLTYHLKTFCFNHFQGSKYDMEFTIYILKNSMVLEEARIIFDPRYVWRNGYNGKTILSTTSRGSLKCQLEVLT